MKHPELCTHYAQVLLPSGTMVTVVIRGLRIMPGDGLPCPIKRPRSISEIKSEVTIAHALATAKDPRVAAYPRVRQVVKASGNFVREFNGTRGVEAGSHWPCDTGHGRNYFMPFLLLVWSRDGTDSHPGCHYFISHGYFPNFVRPLNNLRCSFSRTNPSDVLSYRDINLPCQLLRCHKGVRFL